MHRYSAAGGSSGVPGGSGLPVRDTSRSSDPSFQNSTFSVTAARRTTPLQGYKLRCEKEPLSARLGPPDFYPPTPNCGEEILSKDSCQIGYKELIDGIEGWNFYLRSGKERMRLWISESKEFTVWAREAVEKLFKRFIVSEGFSTKQYCNLAVQEPKEALLSLANNTGLWTKTNVNRYKESIRKRLRELNNALIRKRKAGQVYGVPLSGQLLAKTGIFPEHRTCGEDFRKKWVEDLSQRKRLRALAEHVPHGYQRRNIFEALIKHDVPLLRATWFVKITYLNQVKPMSIGMSAGGPDKSQSKRVDLWTKNVLEYAQSLLDDVCQPGSALQSHSQLMFAGRDSSDGEPDVLKKWHYVVSLAHWHYSEGLLHRTQVVDWALKQLQETETVAALELLLPIVQELIEGICLSQTHVRILVETCLHWLRKLCPTGHISNVSEQSSLWFVTVSLVELLRYLLVIAPDTFVALECFPLPPCIIPGGDARASIDGASEELDKNARLMPEIKGAVEESLSSISGVNEKNRQRELVGSEMVDVIQKRAASLARAVNPVLLRNNEGKVIQALDKAQIQGDVAGAYHCVYNEEFCSSDNLPPDWQAEVTSGTAFNLSGPVNPSELFAVRFLCEWAVCDFRDTRESVSNAERRHCAFKDVSRVYMAVSVLCMRMSELEKKSSTKSSTQDLGAHPAAGVDLAGIPVQTCSKKGKKGLAVHKSADRISVHNAPFQSPGAIQDLIYAWLDQHECWGGDTSKRLPLLLSELVRRGLFGPDAYVRQLLCNGVLDQQSTDVDIARASRHRHLLYHLPCPAELIADDDIENPSLSEASRLYQNERRLALYGLGSGHVRRNAGEVGAAALHRQKEALRNFDPKLTSGLHDMQGKLLKKSKSQRRKWRAAEVRQLIATCLQFPEGSVEVMTEQLEAKGGETVRGLKREATSAINTVEIRDPVPGCEECSRGKRLKLSEGRGRVGQGPLVTLRDEDEIWWSLKKETKVLDIMKVELPVKLPPKQTTRGRPKTVRKTQSLAQLAAPRTESNQGASSSHVLETKVSCPYHQPGSEAGNVTQVKDNTKAQCTGDLRSIGAAMKRLRVGENHMIVSWLGTLVRTLVSSGGLTVPSSHYNQGLGNGEISDSTLAESGNITRWRMGEEQLAIIVFVMDMGSDFHALLQLLLWLLPIAAAPPSKTPGHVNRGMSPFPGKEASLCDVGEAAILSCLQRYEGLLAAMDLLPQALSAGMQRAANVMAAVPGGRAGCSALLCYVRDLLRKYGGLASVQAWEKRWKASCDQRLGAELEALKAGDSDGGFGLVGGMGEDRDDPHVPRLTGRLARVGTSMKDIVQRGMNEVMLIMMNKERDAAALGVSRNGREDHLEDGYRAVQRVVGDIMDSIRQNGGGAPQADSALVAQAVGTVVSNAGASVGNVLDTLGYNILSGSPESTIPAIRCGRRVLQMHVHCLQLLKDGIGERQIRMLEVALATEAGGMVMSGMGQSPGRAPRPQFHFSPETPECNSAMVSDSSDSSSLGRPTIAAAAVAALVACLVVNGVTSLERMVSVLRIRDGLESLLPKPGGPTSNGRVNTMGSTTKADSTAEAHIHWFRVLIGDCQTVVGGLVADLLGEATVLGLARLQRSMPLTTVFPPAYAIFAAALRRQQPFYINTMNREDTVIQAITVAVNDMVAHEPFRDVCLRDTRALYLLLSVDAGESEYAAMLDMQGLELYKKVSAVVPLRARLFLHALLDRKMPEDDIWGQGRSRATNEPGQVEQVIRVLDELQAATFHWQWVELRLLLNEQVVLEKLKTHSQSAQEAVQAAMQGTDRQQLAECEKTFTEVVLTRLLVRPDAAGLYSEAVHSLGRALEEYLILQVKWVLEGSDMLQGRKSLRQLLDSIAVRQGFSVGSRRAKSWGWQPPEPQGINSLEIFQRKQSSLQGGASPEEGELEDDGMVWQKSEEKSGRQSSSRLYSQPFGTENGLANLVLPCLARSSNDTCSGFAFELVKQMINLEQHINNVTRSNGRMSAPTASGGDGILGPKGSGVRRGARSSMDASSPGLGRKFTGAPDSVPVPAAALQTSIWLRLQFLLPLLPMIQTEREQQPARNMRHTLAPVILRLLSTRVVQEVADQVLSGPLWESSPSVDLGKKAQAASAAAATSAGEPLFDRLLSVLHALLSSTWAVWLKPRSSSKGPVKPLRDFAPFDREVAERMQVDVEQMPIPAGARTRLQAAMPLLLPAPMATIAAGPPQIPSPALTHLQSTVSSTVITPSVGHSGASRKLLLPLENIVKAKTILLPDPEMEVDPWTLLEDGVGASTGLTGVGEVGNPKACVWLKGAVRVRRCDLTYVGAVDEDP